MPINLEQRIRSLRQQKDILIMSHAVMGYPSFEENRKLIAEYSKAGVEMVELQFPFSEPIADGPILIKANHESIEKGTRVDGCFRFAHQMTKEFPEMIFLIMTYYNILFSRGIDRFVQEASQAGIGGIIVPDFPPEESKDYIKACQQFNLSPIFLFSPTNSDKRLKVISQLSKGMVYCVARKGVTGYHTLFSKQFEDYLARAKKATHLPLGVGFGVQTKEDVDHLKGKADIAIVCTQAIKIAGEKGAIAAGEFLKGLRN